MEVNFCSELSTTLLVSCINFRSIYLLIDDNEIPKYWPDTQTHTQTDRQTYRQTDMVKTIPRNPLRVRGNYEDSIYSTNHIYLHRPNAFGFLANAFAPVLRNTRGHNHVSYNVRCKMHQTRQVKRTSRLRLRRKLKSV